MCLYFVLHENSAQRSIKFKSNTKPGTYTLTFYGVWIMCKYKISTTPRC